MAKTSKAAVAADEPAAAPADGAVTLPGNTSPDGFHAPSAMAGLAHPERPALDFEDPDD